MQSPYKINQRYKLSSAIQLKVCRADVEDGTNWHSITDVKRNEGMTNQCNNDDLVESDQLSVNVAEDNERSYDHDKHSGDPVSDSDKRNPVANRLEDQIQKPKIFIEYTNPIDHGWSWMIVLGVFGICLFTIGALKSFGVLYVEMAQKYNVSNKALSSVQSLNGFLFLGLGPVSNALSIRYTQKVVAFIGGVLTATGIFLAAFSSFVEVLFITYGLIAGCGMGLCFSPSIVVIAFYFKKRRALATGLALSGGGLGAMILPYFIRYLLSEYGLSGALIIYAGILSNICVFAMLLRPYQSYPMKHVLNGMQIIQKGLSSSDLSNNLDIDVRKNRGILVKKEEKLDYSYSELNAKCSLLSKESTVSRSDKMKESQDHFEEACVTQVPNIANDEDNTLLQNENEHKIQLGLPAVSRCSLNQSLSALGAISCQDIRGSVTESPEMDLQSNEHPYKRNESLKRTLTLNRKCLVCLRKIDWNLFKTPLFVLLFVMVIFAMIGYHSLFNIIPSFAEEVGLSHTDGAFILLVFGLGDLIGRAAVGLIMDIFQTKKLLIYTICVLFSACGIILTPFFTTLLKLCIFMSAYSVFAGGYNGTLLVIVVESIGLERLPSAWGFICFGVAIGMLTNPVISGGIRDATGTWTYALQFTGSMSLVAVVLLVIPLVMEKRLKHESKNRVKD